ncbi:hypothetical protein [Streptomyces sp. NPDC127092]|uniref:hypothetical protein n=1 Tax=Streptomyces sp. NPDC127092 TaxID=3347135 RepID=UPI003647D15C
MPLAHNADWPHALRTAVICAATLLGLLLLVDAVAEALSPVRGALWSGLAVLLFVVLLPDRVTAGEGWLATHGLVRRRTVRIDRLVRVGWSAGPSRHVLLQDVHGARISLSPNLLADNPRLWQLLADGAAASSAPGFLHADHSDIRHLSQHTDSEIAHLVFKVSHLD